MATYSERYLEWLAGESVHRSTVIRWALGTVMFLAGMHKFFEPAAWSTYVAQWLQGLMILPLGQAIVVLGIGELLLGIAILADYRTEWTASLSGLAIFLILFNLLTTGNHLDVLFMNVGLFGLAFSVAMQAASD